MGYPAAVRHLVKAQADINAADVNGKTATMLAALEGHVDVVKAIRDIPGVAASDHLALKASDGRTALHHAILLGHLPVVIALMEGAGSGGASPADVIDSLGEAPLHLALRYGRDDIALHLAGHGANVNLPTSTQGWTPIFYAVRDGKVKLLQHLLDAGADPSCASKDRVTTPLHLAVDCADKEAIAMLCQRGGEGIVDCADSLDQTALFLAIAAGKTDFVDVLLDANASVNNVAAQGDTPLMLAADGGYVSSPSLSLVLPSLSLPLALCWP